MVESNASDSLLPAHEEPRPGVALSGADFEAYRHAVEEHAMVAVTSRRGVIVYVNDRFCEVSGYSREEFIGVTHGRANSGRHSHQFWRDLWQTIGAGREWHGEICNSRHDRSEYWVESIILPLGTTRASLGISHCPTSAATCGTQASSARQPRWSRLPGAVHWNA